MPSRHLYSLQHAEYITNLSSFPVLHTSFSPGRGAGRGLATAGVAAARTPGVLMHILCYFLCAHAHQPSYTTKNALLVRREAAQGYSSVIVA